MKGHFLNKNLVWQATQKTSVDLKFSHKPLNPQ